MEYSVHDLRKMAYAFDDMRLFTHALYERRLIDDRQEAVLVTNIGSVLNDLNEMIIKPPNNMFMFFMIHYHTIEMIVAELGVILRKKIGMMSDDEKRKKIKDRLKRMRETFANILCNAEQYSEQHSSFLTNESEKASEVTLRLRKMNPEDVEHFKLGRIELCERYLKTYKTLLKHHPEICSKAFGRVYASRFDERDISEAIGYLTFLRNERQDFVKKADIDAWYGANKHIESIVAPLSQLKLSERSKKCNEAKNGEAVETYFMREINVMLKILRVLELLSKHFNLAGKLEKHGLDPIVPLFIQHAIVFACYLKMEHHQARAKFSSESERIGCNNRILFDKNLERVKTF